MSGAWLNVASQMNQAGLIGLIDVREEAANKRAEDYNMSETIIDTNLKAVLTQIESDVVFDCIVPESHTGNDDSSQARLPHPWWETNGEQHGKC